MEVTGMSLRKLYAPALLFFLTLLFAPCVSAQTDARAQAAAEIESLRAQIKSKEAVLLATPKEDRKTYAEFLAQPDTGLMRLLPREKWDGKLSTRGGGAYYSFTSRTHEYGNGSDIELQQDKLSVGFAGADFGFMIDLGDVPLENVSEHTENVQFMASFTAPSAERDARASYRDFAEGRKQLTYWSTLPVFAGDTYVLRSINYDHSDVLVAFRIVRKDADGSVVLLWKTLKTFPKPELQRNIAAGR
jgi:hypothetical protein